MKVNIAPVKVPNDLTDFGTGWYSNIINSRNVSGNGVDCKRQHLVMWEMGGILTWSLGVGSFFTLTGALLPKESDDCVSGVKQMITMNGILVVYFICKDNKYDVYLYVGIFLWTSIVQRIKLLYRNIYFK